ncbi:MAG: hypothetical protein AB8B82_13955 [Roseovarius sp.]
MTLPADHIEYRFDRGEEGPALNSLRRRGLRSPRDLLTAEAVRVGLVLLPIGLYLADVIRYQTAFALLIGYVVARWFDHVIRPRILSRVSPARLRWDQGGETVVRLDQTGLRLTTELTQLRVDWPAIEATRVGQGYILRIAPQLSVVFLDAWIPEGWNVDMVSRALSDWSGQNIA